MIRNRMVTSPQMLDGRLADRSGARFSDPNPRPKTDGRGPGAKPLETIFVFAGAR